jgi:hypothetical protein
LSAVVTAGGLVGLSTRKLVAHDIARARRLAVASGSGRDDPGDPLVTPTII